MFDLSMTACAVQDWRPQRQSDTVLDSLCNAEEREM